MHVQNTGQFQLDMASCELVITELIYIYVQATDIASASAWRSEQIVNKKRRLAKSVADLVSSRGF